MFSRFNVLLGTAALVLSLAVAPEGPASAGGDQKVTKVLNAILQDMPGKEANIVLFEVRPGWTTKRHFHPGHVFVYVIEGAIEIDVKGREPVRVEAGGAFHEIPDQPMTAKNESSSEGARFVVFQVGKQGEPLMIAQPQ